MRRVWAAALVLFIVLILALAPRLFLVPRLSAEMAGQLAAALNTDEVDLEIGAPLGWELLLGRIPHFEVTAADARLGGLGISRVELEGDGLLFQPWTLFKERDLLPMDFGALRGWLRIDEADLNEVFWREVDPSRKLWLEVWPEGLVVLGTVTIWDMDLSINIVSDVLVESGSALRFAVKELAVQDAWLPDLLLDMLKDSFAFTVDLGEFPLPVEIQTVELLEHEIKIGIGGRQ